MEKLNKGLPFYLFVFGFFLIMIAPFLLSHGMFMDGLFYATASNNLAHDMGSYWDIFISESTEKHFREHPPMAFWIQSFFYRIFGDSVIIERIYSALTYVITGLIIAKIWNYITKSKSMSWLPLLFFVAIPIVTQAARNNLLENTMMVFTTLAAFLLIKNQDQKKIVNIILAGGILFLALLTKGLVALFIWSIPFWFYLFSKEKDTKSFLKNTLILVLSTILPLVIMCIMIPESKEYLTTYFNKQIAGSIANVQTVNSRFWIIIKLFKEFITPILLMVLIFFLSLKHKEKTGINKTAILFIILGLSGVIPIMISLKQSGFYFIPALPFLSIGLALLIKSRVVYLYNKLSIQSIGYKIFSALTVISIFIGIGISIQSYDTNKKEKDKLNDIFTLFEHIPSHTTIGVSCDYGQDWSSIGYFFRYKQINLDHHTPYRHDLYITSIKTDEPPLPIGSYELIDIGLKKNKFYKKK